jgi:hypothetical protein
MRMRTAVLFLFAAVLAAPAAAQETRTWHSDSGYAVDLPDSWIRVADRHIDNIRRNVSPENAVGTQSVEMAFETGAARYPAAPFAVIARVDFGYRITREEFSAQFHATDQSTFQTMADSVPGVRTRMDVPVWDADIGAGLLRAGVQTAVSGPLFTWTALAPRAGP